MSISCQIENDIAEVVMHHPPVNSITVGDTWAIRDTFKELNEMLKNGARNGEVLRWVWNLLDHHRAFWSITNAEYALESLEQALKDDGSPSFGW